MIALIYLFNGRFPTEKAHGIQIAKMCEAYERAGTQVTLMIPWQRNLGDVEMYGLKKSFTLKRVWALDPVWLWNISQKLGHFVRITTGMIGHIFAILKLKADIYYARDYSSIILLALLGRQPVVEIHDYRLTRSRWLLGWALRRAHLVVCNSKGTLSAIIKHYPNIITTVVPNGVDPGFFNIPETKEEARAKLNLPQDKIIIGYVGRTEVAGMDKGLGMLKEAFERMNFRTQAELLLVVSVPYTQVPLYLRAIDIGVIPYPGEQHAKTTSPIKRFEYEAARKTIVIADSPDSQRLAEKLDDALKHPHPYDGKLCTWDERARKILDLINEKP